MLQRSIFDACARERTLGTALLLDGNIGIGGASGRAAPKRCRDPADDTRPGPCGDRPTRDTTRSRTVRLEHGGTHGPWFAWADIGVDNLDELADDPGLRVRDVWTDTGRWFAQLDK